MIAADSQVQRALNALERLVEYAESISGWDFDTNGDYEAIDDAKKVLDDLSHVRPSKRPN
jgi:hypothetical protein